MTSIAQEPETGAEESGQSVEVTKNWNVVKTALTVAPAAPPRRLESTYSRFTELSRLSATYQVNGAT